MSGSPCDEGETGVCALKTGHQSTPSTNLVMLMSTPSGKLLPVRRGALRVLSLNLGGRNTNPVEFELKGDSSETALEATAALRKAGKALKSVAEGPQSIPQTERQLIQDILSEIYEGQSSEAHVRMEGLLQNETWSKVIAHVKECEPHLFNALNLSTLRLSRPSVWEDPGSCKQFSNAEEYLMGWRTWYCSLDRKSKFWQEDAPRTAKKRNLDLPTAFAGLLLFDVMCVCTARCAFVNANKEKTTGEGAREVRFAKIARFAARLPASNVEVRHNVAEQVVQRLGAHVLLAQEARDFAEHPGIAEDFMPAFRALDGFTAVLLRKEAFAKAADISTAVAERMEDLIDPNATQKAQAAWRTTAKRLAAVHCHCTAQVGGFHACVVSLHCSKSESTVSFIACLREVISEYSADINIVGMDSNCSGKEAESFQKRLRYSGFMIGVQEKQDQVTVVKQRTHFQTQVQKGAETDISHKDYILSWGPGKVRRGDTTYMPDLRTAFGMDQDTKQCVRLPTTRWPFDHCSVATTFRPRRGLLSSAMFRLSSWSFLCSCALVCFVLFVLLLPLASTERDNPYGPRGTWHNELWPGTARVGLCQSPRPRAGAGCQNGWLRENDKCYKASPKMGFEDAEKWCEAQGDMSSLLSISSETENQFVTDFLCPHGEFCWIGLRGADSPAFSWWVSGEPVTYTRMIDSPDKLFPLSKPTADPDTEVAVISNLPGTVNGCRAEFLVILQEQPPLYLFIVVVGPALALVFTTVMLLLPRPAHLLTTVYISLIFVKNLVWFMSRMVASCLVDNMDHLLLFHFFGRLVTMLGAMGTSMFAAWIFIKRLSLLHPTGTQRIIFRILILIMYTWLLHYGLFKDTSQQVIINSMVMAGFALTGAMTLVYLAFSVTLAQPLYQVWAALRKETMIGCNNLDVGTNLSRQVRAARIHFLSLLAATISGICRWGASFTVEHGLTRPTYPYEEMFLLFVLTIAETATNELCVHILAALDMDDAVVCAKGITTEVARRAQVEVRQHQIAVRFLQAAPTSKEELQNLSQLEGEARQALDAGEDYEERFKVLQAAVGQETVRVHSLMECVRLRSMTMPLRYQYLIDVPVVQGTPRQHVPAEYANGPQTPVAADAYFNWLYGEAEGAQTVLFNTVKQLLAKFNSTPWPSDLGLSSEDFPWSIWASGPKGVAMRRLDDDVISPGDILQLVVNKSPNLLSVGMGGSSAYAHCLILEDDTDCDSVKVHCSGCPTEEWVERGDLRIGNSGGVFLPGPIKKKARCGDKIAMDYEGKEPWPAAASVLDICRCMILLDDPYAIAVLVAYISQNMTVLRMKNRFSEDVLEPKSPEELQAIFHAASEPSADGPSCLDSQYRDISMNVQVPSLNSVPFVCEIQVSLSNLAILKCADTKLYTLRRMKSPQELRSTLVFKNPTVERLSLRDLNPRNLSC